MSGHVEASIIIPVFNQWELTRACLEALAATTAGRAVEIIVVDNASSDATPEACPFLGERLFGTAFRYHRCPANLNFGPASNLGAKLASGEFLIFLNNDTVPLPGWYQPLIDDFSVWPDIAATGPLLLYPESEPFGYTVQHLGVFVSPNFNVGHLYEGIPADCALAKKRRFFQVITAACMVMRRSVFMKAGLFDEHYINGFEDVDLCARLWQAGYRMTVNPEARVVHHTSRTPGRHRHENANSQYFAAHSRSLLVPDWHIHLKNDGMLLRVGPWQTLQASLTSEQCLRLDKIAAAASCDELGALLARHPLWENGWRSLISKKGQESGRMALQFALFKLYPSPEGAMELYMAAMAAHDTQKIPFWFNNLTVFCKPLEEYLSAAESMRAWCAGIGLDEMAAQYADWIAGVERFRTEQFLPFLAQFWQLTRKMPLHPHATWAYTLWRHNVDLPRRGAEANKIFPNTPGPICFSVLMPVYNPRIEHLAAALDSVLEQEYPHWELCIADDASTDPGVKAVLTGYAERDSRIRVAWRRENGHIAAATNTALEMAGHPYAALMDQDDLLTPDALRTVAEAITNHPDGLLFYSDEDKIHDDGFIFYPHFKNGRWDWELLYGQNFVNHLGVYRTDRLREIGGFREGFRGAQDFDMLLRYTAGADAARFVHIPRVLYHWRAHADSTASHIDAKNEVRDSSQRALQEALDAHCPGASAAPLPTVQFLRVEYPLPEKRPLVSLILDFEESLPLLEAQVSALEAKTAYGKHEILVLFSKNTPQAQVAKARRIADSYNNVRLTPHAAGLSLAERLQWGARHAHGQILGFLPGGIVPLTEGWLEELVSCLCREGVGAVGGKLLHRRGTLLHGGWLADAGGSLNAVFQGISANEPVWFGWNYLSRTVDALDALCLFTRSETLAEAGGFDAALPDASVPDYCLRLGEKGLRTVWWPFAEFMLIDDRRARVWQAAGDSGFAARWAGRLTPLNENLAAAAYGWALHVNEPCEEETAPLKNRELKPELGVEDFSAEDYLALYPDVRERGMDPLDHYLRHGRKEGRKPRRSRVDYSRLTPERLAAFRAAPCGDIVVCTSIAGGYERLLPPAFLNDGWRYVCYADEPLESWGIWDVRPIPYDNADPTRKSRWAKLHLPELFPEARWILWLDANIVITGDLSALMASCDEEPPLYSVRHPKRDCLYDEALACIEDHKEKTDIIRRQITAYEEQGMPAHGGLYENNVFLLNPRHPQARPLFSRWWDEYEKYSKRDQISLPYVLYANGMTPGRLFPEGDTAKNHPALCFLTHEETGWVSVPESVKEASAR